MNLFFICEYLLLNTTKMDIILSFKTTFNQGSFSYAYYSYNLGIVGMIYQEFDASIYAANEYEQLKTIKENGLTQFEERQYDYLQFRK